MAIYVIHGQDREVRVRAADTKQLSAVAHSWGPSDIYFPNRAQGQRISSWGQYL